MTELPSNFSEIYAKALAALSAVEYRDFNIPDEEAQTKAVMRVVLEHLLDYGGEARYNEVELSATYVADLYEALTGEPYAED